MDRYVLALFLVVAAAVQTAQGPVECRPYGCPGCSQPDGFCCAQEKAPCGGGESCNCGPAVHAVAPAVFAVAAPDRVVDCVPVAPGDEPAEAGAVLFRPPIA
ncbi:MAG: hypothetical protein AAB152_10240 [Candidatus Coatesbacteria bacterium]